MTNGNHDFGDSGICAACGVPIEAIEDNVASRWCTNFQPTPVGRVGMWLHWAAIVLLVGGPLAGFIAPTSGFVQFVMAFIIGGAALAVADIHARLFDEIIEEFRGDRQRRDAWLAEDVRRVLNGEVSE